MRCGTCLTSRSIEMALRRARQLVVLMAKEFQPYGATWAELKNKSGIPPTSYKRAFNRATEMKWFVGGGKQGAAYNLNPDGCWRAALFPGPIGPEFNPETETNGPNADPVRTLDKADSHLALMSEAIQYVDQKKRS